MSKYGAKKVDLDGYTFDSKAEAHRYRDLKYLASSPDVISNIEVHPVFVLQPAFIYFGKRIRQVTYTADFKYIEHDNPDKRDVIVVEDVKGGKATMTQLFNVKWKMARYQHMNMDFRIVHY